MKLCFLFSLQFFDHPIITDLMAERWYGGQRYLKASTPWWLFLNIWCLFDIFLFPLVVFGFIAKSNVTQIE